VRRFAAFADLTFALAAAALRAMSERCFDVSFFKRAAALSLPPFAPIRLKYSMVNVRSITISLTGFGLAGNIL
jgi:hypothetical protein